MQWLLVLSALVAIFLALRPNRFSDATISVILSLIWLWTGAVYHLWFFTRINPAANLFAALFMVQAAIFWYAGLTRKSLIFRIRLDVYGVAGALMIFYALIGYPILGQALGRIYPQSPTFGLPCPTTIFTFGLLLWAEKKVPSYVWLIPLVWSLIGFSAAITLNIREDHGLVLAGIVGTVLILWRDTRHSGRSHRTEHPKELI